MKLIVDNQIARLLAHDPSKILKSPIMSNPDNLIQFRWPSLLEYLGLGSLLLDLPVFDKTNPLFGASISTMWKTDEKEVIFHVYDHLFTEILNQIRALPQINGPFLLQSIKAGIEKSPKILLPALVVYEGAFLEKAAHTMHDLILYLAWDRMCVWMASLINYQSTDSKFVHGLDVLQQCLIESYHHITQQGRTSPSLYRMIETLFYYQMREENLQNHTAEEWTLLSQSFPNLKGENELTDIYYIDDAAIHEENCYLTLDSSDTVDRRVALAQFMIAKINERFPQWEYVLHPQNVVHLMAPTFMYDSEDGA